LGGKQIRGRQYFYLSFTCLIYLVLLSCATIEGIKNRQNVYKHLQQSHNLLVQGDYKGSLQENQKVLSLSDETSHKDEALFNIALIYAHYNNPEKDYKKSRMYFTELIEEYPQSALVEQAKIWLGIFNVIEREKQVDIEIERKKKELKK